MSRNVVEGRQPQGANEVIRYRFAADPAAVSVVAVTAIDETTGQPATGLFSGEPTVQGGDIILPPLANVLPGHTYRVSVRYTDASGNVLEPYFYVEGER